MDNKRSGLISSGLISTNDDTLIEFINFNGIDTIDEFIEMMDNNSFNKEKVYSDVLLQARGIADLLKLKYFDISLNVDSYLSSVVSKSTFKIYDEEFVFLAVTDSYGKKTNIYSAITRLGFSDKERQVILNNDIEGRLLIDVLNDVYMDIVSNEHTDVVFCNKLMLIITYYKNKLSKPKSTSDIVDERLKELKYLLDRKNDLEKTISELSEKISLLNSRHKGV